MISLQEVEKELKGSAKAYLYLSGTAVETLAMVS
jgi:hypothetical protein